MSASERDVRSNRRVPRHRLSVRVTVALCLGISAIYLVAGFLNISLQRTHLTRLVQASAERNADTIRRSTREAMLRNDPDAVHRIITSIGAQDGIDRIRIFDKEGRIRMSTWPDESGQVLDKQAEQCYGCHAADRPLTHLDRPDRVRIFGNSNGSRILGVIAPIRNEPDCTLTCHAHSPGQQVLGVLDVQMSLGPVDEQIVASEKQLALWLVVSLAAVLLMTGFLIWSMVLRPVRRLTEAARLVRAGDLSARVPVDSSDEIGEMAESWNEMLAELTQTRRELEDWSLTLERRVEQNAAELEAAHRRMLVVEKMASLGKLAAVVAHEINNPLAGIGTYARLLAKRIARSATPGSPDEENVRVLKMIDEETMRCGNIVRNLLMFSRTPGARFSVEPLQPLLERCVMLVRHKAELQDVRIELSAPTDLPPIACDPSQLQQLFLVLTMNAIEAMPDGGELGIVLEHIEEEGSVVVSVSDTGSGIPSEHLDHVFEPFFTTKEEGRGVGLGLSIAYGIVNRHRGHIDARSSPGSKTVFTVRLPLSQPEAPDDDSRSLDGLIS